MTADEKIDLLVQQAAELPDEAQAELFKSLAEMLGQDLGLYEADYDER